MQARRKSGFPGGIHPTRGEDKELSRNQPIIDYHPQTVKISMKQSSFGSCKEIVHPGETVAYGQLIGEAQGPLSVNVHASIPGVVREIVDEKLTEKDTVRVCIIERTQSGRPGQPDYEKYYRSLPDVSREEILHAIRDKGICGMGGAGFPTDRKYQTEKPIHTVLVNGAECEPYLTCDDRLMQEEPYAILCGMALMKKAAGAGQVILCIEENKKEALALFQELLKGDGRGMKMRKIPARYPQGGEKQLIQTVLGTEVPYGGLTMDVGVLVSNVATVKACADAVLMGRPLTHRIVTVSGEVVQPGNYRVPIGTALEELLELSHGVTSENLALVLGGPMTGKKIASSYRRGTALPGVGKTTSALLALPETQYMESPCIRCGACGQVCPAGLIPFQIEFAYLKEDAQWCDSLSAPACIGCGCCSYVCPARRPLARRVGEAIGMIRRQKS